MRTLVFFLLLVGSSFVVDVVIVKARSNDKVFIIERQANVSDTTTTTPPQTPRDISEVCKEQQDALNTCVQANSCQLGPCGDRLYEGREEPILEQGFGPDEEQQEGGGEEDLPDISIIINQINTYLKEMCTFLKDNGCILRECCAACANEFEASYNCTYHALYAVSAQAGLIEIQETMVLMAEDDNEENDNNTTMTNMDVQRQAPLPTELELECDISLQSRCPLEANNTTHDAMSTAGSSYDNETGATTPPSSTDPNASQSLQPEPEAQNETQSTDEQKSASFSPSSCHLWTSLLLLVLMLAFSS